MTTPIEGGCFCGEIRYRVNDEATLQLLCFCKDCVAITGTDGYAGYMVKDEHFQVLAGKPNTHVKVAKSGRKIVRHFCGNCGSNLWGQTEMGLTSIAAGSLDDPTLFNPTHKVFTEDALSWARVPEELDEFD